MQGLDRAVGAIKSLIDYASLRKEVPDIVSSSKASARAVLEKALKSANGAAALDEVASKKLLKAYGIPVSKEEIAQTAAEAVKIAKKIGFPVVAKVVSADILHKSDIGGVVLNLNSAAEVKKAFDDITRRVKKLKSKPKLEGILIAQQVKADLELVVGASLDAEMGPVVLFGTGGVDIELMKDVALAGAPLDAAEAKQLIHRTKAGVKMKGYRGKPALHEASAVKALVGLSNLMADAGSRIASIDVNPFLINSKTRRRRRRADRAQQRGGEEAPRSTRLGECHNACVERTPAKGGCRDLLARAFGDFISRQVGKTVVIENKAGASGSIGAAEVARSAPDGLTILCSISTTYVMNRAMMKNPGYDMDKDLTLVSVIPGAGLLLVASPKSGVKTLDDFVAFARKSGKVNFGTYSAGSSPHMTINELNRQYGLNIEPIHYRGEAPMWTGLAEGTLDVAMGSYTAAQSVLQSNHGVVFAVHSKKVDAIPDIKTLPEQGATSKFFTVSGFTGWALPKATPQAIVDRLAELCVAANGDPKVKEVLATFVLEPAIGFKESNALYQHELPVWLETAKALNLEPA